MPLSDQERRVCDLIRSRERALVEDLRLHVGLATGGRNIEALHETGERLESRAIAIGATGSLVVGRPRPVWLHGQGQDTSPLTTLVLARRGYPEPRELLISGHMDTVHDPRGPFKELTIAPDGKTATGPGCVDMKGGLVIAMAAMEALAEENVRLDWTLILNSDEETGSYESAHTIAAEARRVAAAGGLGIALEPATADGGLVIERAGSAQFMIEVQGKAAHVGRDFASGRSAVIELASIILEVARLANPTGGLIVNVGPLQGGAATNVVPDLARAWGNVRFGSVAQWESFAARLKGLEGARPSGTSVVVQCDLGRPAKPATPQVREFAELSRGAAADLGQPLPFSKTAGVCDGNNMQAAGLPTLDTLGVRGGGLHTPQEWIDLSSLVERCQLLAVTMMRASRRD